MNEPDKYFLGYRLSEQQRLQKQAEQLAHETSWLLDQMVLPSGARALEIGCGPRGNLDLLADRVGPQGTVVGIERSEEAVSLARAFIAKLGINNVEILHGDAQTMNIEDASFDLVTARLVLVNVPDPVKIITKAVSLTRTDGIVAFHEIDWSGVICDPPEPAWDTLIDLFVNYTNKNGIDLFIGRKLPRLLRNAGLVDICMNPISHVHPPGDPRRTLLLDFSDNLKKRILAQNLIDEKSYSELQERVRQHIENPETTVMVGPYVQVWGRKPK